MFTDHDAALLVTAQYAGDWSSFDIFVDPAHNDYAGVAWAAKRVGDLWAICFEGSHDAPDWVHDANVATVVTEFGEIHAGFYAGMVDTWRAIGQQLSPGRKILLGHSLGAARADIAAGLAILDGEPPAFYLRWGEPAPAKGPLFGARLANVPGRSYRNIKPHGYATDVDHVTQLPLTWLNWRHPQSFSDVWAAPGPVANLWSLLFACHHYPLYLSATPETVILP